MNGVLDRALNHLRPDALVIQRDDGLFQIGWHPDATGPFESRSFAEAVAARRADEIACWQDHDSASSDVEAALMPAAQTDEHSQ